MPACNFVFPGNASVIGYFKEAQSGSVKKKTTWREGKRGGSAAVPRSPSRRVVFFFTLPLWASLKYPINMTGSTKFEACDFLSQKPQKASFSLPGVATQAEKGGQRDAKLMSR